MPKQEAEPETITLTRVTTEAVRDILRAVVADRVTPEVRLEADRLRVELAREVAASDELARQIVVEQMPVNNLALLRRAGARPGDE